jgi:hypothetical protein
VDIALLHEAHGGGEGLLLLGMALDAGVRTAGRLRASVENENEDENECG